MADTLHADIEVRIGITYATHDGVALMGDFYAPKERKDAPILIGVHGGGWQVGTRDFYRYWGPYLAKRGYGLFSIDYRLVQEGRKMFPEAVQDVRAAVQYVRAHAAELNIDPARIALIGDSAGAHLSALVALAGDSPPFCTGYPSDQNASVSSSVKAVVLFYGVYDMAAQWRHDQLTRPRDQISQKFLGVPPAENRRLYFDASPLSYVQADGNATSFLLTYGTEDNIVDRVTQSEAMLTALSEAGKYVRTVIVQSAPHFWSADPIEEEGSFSGFLAPRLLRFLKERL
ncbi:Acetyl esterase/lipase [Rhizobiales bacterium GAS191]|nr:Acetyl esterase/lipase [Rhizobiales bacterium GAS191]SEE40072.1 Acetyl esterase/lipase [Rhizobiales bacterium GAS188]